MNSRRRSPRLVLPVASAVALAALAARPAVAATGGPDSFGYTWADSNEPGVSAALPPTTGPGTVVRILTDNSLSAPAPLGFSFPFYGATYTDVVFSDNGWLTFDTTTTDSAPVPERIPAATRPNAVVAWYWRDLLVPSSLISYPIANGRLFFVRTTEAGAGGRPLEIWISLYESGLIHVVYLAVGQTASVSLGVEDAAGGVGLNPLFAGASPEGFVLVPGTALVYYPPSKLDCAGALALACGQTVPGASPGALSSNVTGYPCASGTYLGRERILEFTNPTLSDVTLTLANVGGRAMDLVVLRRGACNEFQCLASGDTSVSLPWLEPGDYAVVVDGRTTADDGPFEVSAACVPRATPIACRQPGDPPVPGTTSGPNGWDIYACTNQTMTGPEDVYEIAFTPPGNLKAVLTPQGGAELDLMLFGPDDFDAPTGCVDWADSSLTAFDPAPGRYWLVVDGRDPNGEPNAGSYELSLTCEILLDCSAPAGDLFCATDTSGTTAGAANRAELYGCSPDLFSGGEVVYRFTNAAPRTVSFLYQGPPDLGLFILPASNCNEGACLEKGEGRLIARELPAGDWLVVVDGKNGASGAFTLTPVCESTVTPAQGSFRLVPGQTVHERKEVVVNADVSRGDIVFSMDLTGSMSRLLPAVKDTARAIIDELSQTIDDVNFGLVSFEDYPGNYSYCGYGATYGSPADRPYRRNLPLTNDLAALDAAILGLPPGQGGDGPESYLRVLFEMYADAANLGWRSTARKISVMFGDNPPHVCDGSPCMAVASGIDPGRDQTVGTADDLDMASVQAELLRQGIVPIYLDAGGGVTTAWDCWNRMGGGQAYTAPGGSLPPTLVDDLGQLIISRALECRVLEPRANPPSFQSWISNVTPTSWNTPLPARVTFDFDVGPPLGTAPGIYSFMVDMVCDGVVKASQSLVLEVATCVSPTGSVGNALRAARQGDDVALDWRGAPLSPRRYNLHRPFDKLTLAPPRTDAAFAPVTDAESWVATGDVTAAPSLIFYDVWGRDCADASIFQ